MGTPQIIYIIVASIHLLLTAHMHGKPKEGKYNIWIALIGAGLGFTLLIAGGFFK